MIEAIKLEVNRKSELKYYFF